MGTWLANVLSFAEISVDCRTRRECELEWRNRRRAGRGARPAWESVITTNLSLSRPKRTSQGTMRSTNRWRSETGLSGRNKTSRFQNVVPDVVCPGGKCGLSEDGKDPVEDSRRREVNEAVTGSAEGDAEGEGPDIYIDDAVDEEEEEKAENSHPASP